MVQNTTWTATQWYCTYPSVCILIFKNPIPYETGDVDVNESGHQVLTIKAIHYATVPRDCVCKILLGLKDREEKKIMLTDSDETHSSSITSQQCFKAVIKLWFYCVEHKVRKSLLAKEVFNCQGLSRNERKKRKQDGAFKSAST